MIRKRGETAKLNFIKMKNICLQKTLLDNEKMSHRLEILLLNHIFDLKKIRFVPTLHKKLPKVNNKKTNNPLF